MSNKLKWTIFIINLAVCIAVALFAGFLMNSWGIIVRVVFFCAAGAGIAASLVSFFLKKYAVLKSAFILLLLVIIVQAAFIAVGEIFEFGKYKTDAERVDALVVMIKQTGGWGMVVFFVIQILQVVILPLPAAVCYIPGAQIWGAWIGTLLASTGVLAGSVIAYFIGKIWGKKAVTWIAGKEATDKYTAYFGKKGKILFVLMQILPFFPDDILCMVAGLTAMNFPFFIVTMVVVRPIIIAAYCFLGSGTLIPFTGWGIAVWIAIFAVCIALAVLSWKYQDKFENWLVSKFRKKNSDETIDKPEEE